MLRTGTNAPPAPPRASWLAVFVLFYLPLMFVVLSSLGHLVFHLQVLTAPTFRCLFTRGGAA